MKNFTQHLPNSPLSFDMIFVQGGTFRMGSDKATDTDAYDDEMPAHDVTVPDFYLAQFPVTQDIWREITGENPAFFQGDRRPVENVSWNDIVNGDPEKAEPAFLDILQKKTGQAFRLPTEAEWEYAAQGGVYMPEIDTAVGKILIPGNKYAGSDKLAEVGWYDDNSHGETKPVGLLDPNALGLYDMSGNVWEWCADDWHGDYERAPDNGTAWIDTPRGTDRVMRGGSWVYGARHCRAAFRLINTPGHQDSDVGGGHFSFERLIKKINTPGHQDSDVGFRLALSPKSVG